MPRKLSVESKHSNNLSVILILSGAIVAANLISQYLQNIESLKSLPNASTKPYDDFDSFYVFYLTQHSNETNRLLHVIGTSIIIAIIIQDYTLIYSFLMSLMAGLTVFSLTKSVSHGFIEMLTMTIVNQSFVRLFSGSFKKGLSVLLIGYGFAWVGHFFYELNQPATFIYPSYSLLGDFKMLYEYIMSYSKKL